VIELDAVLAFLSDSWAQPFLGAPLKITAILLIGLIGRYVLHRLIDRISAGIAAGTAGLARLDERHPAATARIVAAPLLSQRREQRARTTSSVLRSLATAVIASIVVITVLDVLAIPVAPLLASAGIVGVAVGFGAQSLVKDVIGGLFMMVEDQYGVGDVVDFGTVGGQVEAVGLRVTRLRNDAGTVWYVRNGDVTRVGNASQGSARAVLDVALASAGDAARAGEALREMAEEMARDEEFGALVTGQPEIWAMNAVSPNGAVLRLVVKTLALRQWDVAIELRRRITERLAAERIGTDDLLPGIRVTDPAPSPALPTPAEGAEKRERGR
jgi:small-conductance mechanosensitive channel